MAWMWSGGKGVTTGHLRVTVGHLRSPKANTTELHPKIRPTLFESDNITKKKLEKVHCPQNF